MLTPHSRTSLRAALVAAAAGCLLAAAPAAPAAPAPADVPATAAATAAATERIVLFDGTSTEGWSQAGPGGFTLDDGALTSYGGLGLLWYSDREFGTSYHLTLDWRMAGDDNSGVHLGFPAGEDPSIRNGGFEVQIDATDSPDRTTGSVYGFQSPDIAARDAALKPPGEWNTFDLRVDGDRLTVRLNGVEINDYTDTVPERRLGPGRIGLQNHGTGDEVSFRNIVIEVLGK